MLSLQNQSSQDALLAHLDLVAAARSNVLHSPTYTCISRPLDRYFRRWEAARAWWQNPLTTAVLPHRPEKHPSSATVPKGKIFPYVLALTVCLWVLSSVPFGILHNICVLVLSSHLEGPVSMHVSMHMKDFMCFK